MVWEEEDEGDEYPQESHSENDQARKDDEARTGPGSTPSNLWDCTITASTTEMRIRDIAAGQRSTTNRIAA